MFVSSYSTYIQTNTSDKTLKERTQRVEERSKSFSSKLEQSSVKAEVKGSNLPIDYISKNQVLNNKQLLKEQKQIPDTAQKDSDRKTKTLADKFSVQNSLINAKGAYENNSKMFSLFPKPHATLDQTPKLENTLPKEPMDKKESIMRHKMVNTYIANDNYYQVTA